MSGRLRRPPLGWNQRWSASAPAKRLGEERFEAIIESLGVEVLPLSAQQARLGLEAFKRFGKGRGGKASLNYGDCFVYALAKELGAPVLFKGDDFAQTDIQPA